MSGTATGPAGWPIAGTGVVNSVGAGTAEVFAALCAGRGAPAVVRSFGTGALRTRHAFEITDPPQRPAAWLCRAVAEALAGAALPEDLSEVPVLVGTGLRDLRGAERNWLAGRSGPPDPHFGRALLDRFGACDTHTFAGACSASLYALALAADLLATGRAETVVVAGVDTITASMYALLDRVQPGAPREVRPFDRRSAGQLLGDGAAAVVLRRPGHGPARAVLRSVGLHCDAGHATAPDPAGLVAAQREAHERAGIKAGEVGLVHAQGTGALLNDRAEARALAEVFGRGGGPLIAAVEGMTGHTSGGSGLLSTVLATECLRTGRVPPVVGLREPIEEAEGLRFSTGDRADGAGLTIAQVNSFGFGGVHAVAVLGKAA
ncbi:beta-ketoacyl synthase N-terminal-like domain-containing protein [Streptomyces albireticuli]|uniref:3-oxoacyl-ACP synthase n=1 Tax=Streptomyces albireticuli TaxID=1940 RepID=A0A2A2CV00_9ACTN|nr:beta-ketoacyl synthase N-terminal-like domain-containing protein [Streptomyces albireticuli]MCD9140971.1 3-oxoacyl-ACP synthase [Streptomyces albireticuli]MCD9161067.1 3-oxoacyl-ACP synthase [Streptomyces albireticuli]MCD9190875.1 3-oxoacyl-ACP synthase [Streptomyces albireticuli]PAU44033.1 3-oxoacyl-ACP synthase [Streptomyces albireticuli]